MQPIPDDAIRFLNDTSLGQDMANPDVRLHRSIMDSHVQHEGEFYDGENEGDDRRNESNGREAAAKSA
ncbi:unnamed protein product, partial [Mesorhabditis belari]